MRRTSSDSQSAAGYAEYSESYRHFDNLIWQLPAWSTAVFAGVLSALSYLSSNEADSLDWIKNLGAGPLAIGLLVGALMFFCAGYYALFRWRVHQRYTERKNARRPLLRWLGGQLFLQLVTGIQAGVILSLTLMAPAKVQHWSQLAVPAFALFGITVATELRLWHHQKQSDRIQIDIEATRVPAKRPRSH